MSKAWMPLFVGDYLGDTTHLTQGQHGAYFLLIMHYWQRETLPTDIEQCYCIAHAMDEHTRCNVDAVLQHFFKKNGTRYYHKRIDAQLSKAKTSYERRVSAANARWKKENTETAEICNASALPMQSYSNPSDSDSSIDLEPKVLEVAKLYPGIADPFHLSREHAGLIVDAIVRHGDSVLGGVMRFRTCYDRWPSADYKFLPSVKKFFGESQYMFESIKWDKGKKTVAPMVNAATLKRQQMEAAE